MELKDVKSTIFSMSVDKPSEIVQGMAHTQQCIRLWLMTRPGEDPLRPEFGCGAGLKIDQPIELVRGEIINDVLTGMRNYFPEIVVKKIIPTAALGKLTIEIQWTYANAALIKEFQKTSYTYGN
jgi:phage baseplate assembly protein W